MEIKYTKELTILPSLCDSSARLGIPDTFALFMDAATEHACALGCGIDVLGPRGLFWLTVRTRVRFYRRPAMLERVSVSTWPEAPERMRTNRDYTIEQGGELLAAGKTEWTVLDQSTGRLYPMSGVFTPEPDSLPAPVWEDPFTRMRGEALEELARRPLRSTDIDLGAHMNNVAYLRSLASAFSCRDWQALNIRELEIAYRAPCYEGETLIWQMRDEGGALSLRGAKEDDTTAVLARIVKG